MTRVTFLDESRGKRLPGRSGTEDADLQRLSHDLLLPARDAGPSVRLLVLRHSARAVSGSRPQERQHHLIDDLNDHLIRHGTAVGQKVKAHHR
jgi:hypothetical protein